MIRCISKYASSLGAFQPGDVVAIPALCAALLADSPGSFEAVQEAVQQPDDEQPEPVPVVTKPARMIRRKG